MSLFRAFFIFFLWTASAVAQTAPAVALYYGSAIPLKEFRVFDIVVVEPGHGHDPQRQARGDSQLFAYVSVAEVQPTRPYFRDIPEPWKLARNGDWNSVVIDQTPADWPAFFAERVVGPLWEKGYRGFFLDTLDSYRLARQFDEAAQQAGLIRVIETLHARYPGIKLILNRGFEIIPRVRDKVFMVAAESLFQGWNAGARRYEQVKAADREWLLGQLKTIQERDRLPILAIDYVAPHDRRLTRDTARRIRELGFIPWVTDAQLDSIGIGSIEVQPRRVLVMVDSREAASLNYANAHRYLQMPLNHLGYVDDYADVRQALPSAIYADRYAGIASWFSGGIADPFSRPYARWLQQRIEQQLPVAVIGDFGFLPDRNLAQRLALQLSAAGTPRQLSITRQHAMLGFETPPLPSRGDPPAFQAALGAGEPLIELRDQTNNPYLGGAIMPWGGFILAPFVLVEVPNTEQARWVIDPFAFLQRALRLPEIPIPDVTTENGRRLFFSHIDGDGFPSLAELPGSPPAAEVLLREILEKYRTPTTVSVIEAEVAPHGLHPQLSPRLEAIARQMFRLPHVEIASHTYAHPFVWDPDLWAGKAGETKNRNIAEGNYHLDVPGYRFDLTREIVGSTNYIRDRLAPPGKPVRILLWSGDTAPGAAALRIAEQAGLLNMNGGDTSITRDNPSLTAVGAHGIEKAGFLQVYAPITNENIYTNLWRGPYYGYERVIESFEMTESPRRLKPVDIYYHAYSASKRAGLNAVHKAFAWMKAQALHPVFASEYIRKVRDFHDLALARDNDGWRIRGNGELRTFRLPAGLPRLADARGVAGFTAGREGRYLHLTGGAAWFASEKTARPNTLQLVDANARLDDWQRSDRSLSFRLKGYVPLEFSLAGIQHCTVSADGQPLTATRQTRQDEALIQHYRHAHAAAQIQVRCLSR